MTPKRTRRPTLARLFDKSTNLIAIVDQQYRLVYANPACSEWLGHPHEQIIGTKLKYGSPVDALETEGIANGLCPPPSIFHPPHKPVHGGIYRHSAESNNWRQATFSWLDMAALDLTGTIIISSGQDLPELPRPEFENTSNFPDWHQALAQIASSDRSCYQYVSLVGETPEMQRLRRQVLAASENLSDCLVIGPPGSHREHVARTIFHMRNYPQASLVPIHCAIMDSQLLQTNIRDWVRDQQMHRTKDWLLLLDVDRLSAEAQTELWGYTEIPNFELRIMATAQSDLYELGRAEQFHRNLALRLSVQVLETIPLAQRRPDIPLIAQYFIEQHNAQAKVQIEGLMPDVIEWFYEYDWPDNLDELKQVVQHACRNCHDPLIASTHLPDDFRRHLAACRVGYYPVEKIQLERFLANVEKQLLHRALQQSRNNKTRAAELLGISRAKLIRKLDAIGLTDKESEPEPTPQSELPEFREAQD